MGTIGPSGDSRGWLVRREFTANELLAMCEPGAIIPRELADCVRLVGEDHRRREWEALAENT